jgi:hypothetical protein
MTDTGAVSWSELRAPMPRWRWRLLLFGTLMALCVYYFNYGREFNEGTNASSPLILALRLVSVTIITASLCPLRISYRTPWLLVGLYTLFALSYLVAFGLAGEINDLLFVNTLIQLPVLWALCHTRWRVDSAAWLRVVATCVILQAFVDLGLFVSGQALWASQAFVGGLGNPSSYGICCAVLLAFCLLHPRAGRWRALKALMLTVIAIMTFSLFASLSVIVAYLIWMFRDVRRLLGAIVVVTVAGAALTGWLAQQEDENFLIHKFSALAAVVGLVQYDTGSSLTVTGRSAGHERTLTAIRDQPLRLISGHLGEKVYWPQDSQVLTYLGSFGAPLLLVFVLLHALWMAYAARLRRGDGGFTLLALALFGLMLFTNRILDYFPVATLYFFCVAMATQRDWQNPVPALSRRADAAPAGSAAPRMI